MIFSRALALLLIAAPALSLPRTLAAAPGVSAANMENVAGNSQAAGDRKPAEEFSGLVDALRRGQKESDAALLKHKRQREKQLKQLKQASDALQHTDKSGDAVQKQEQLSELRKITDAMQGSHKDFFAAVQKQKDQHDKRLDRLQQIADDKSASSAVGGAIGGKSAQDNQADKDPAAMIKALRQAHDDVHAETMKQKQQQDKQLSQLKQTADTLQQADKRGDKLQKQQHLAELDKVAKAMQENQRDAFAASKKQKELKALQEKQLSQLKQIGDKLRKTERESVASSQMQKTPTPGNQKQPGAGAGQSMKGFTDAQSQERSSSSSLSTQKGRQEKQVLEQKKNTDGSQTKQSGTGFVSAKDGGANTMAGKDKMRLALEQNSVAGATKAKLAVVGALGNVQPNCQLPQAPLLATIALRNSGGALAPGKGRISVRENGGSALASVAIQIPAIGSGQVHSMTIPVMTRNPYSTLAGTHTLAVHLDPVYENGGYSFDKSSLPTQFVASFAAGHCGSKTSQIGPAAAQSKLAPSQSTQQVKPHAAQSK